MALTFSELSSDNLKILDQYEGELYRRCLLPVEPEEGGVVVAWVYVLADDRRSLLSEQHWHPERFRRTALPFYLGSL